MLVCQSCFSLVLMGHTPNDVDYHFIAIHQFRSDFVKAWQAKYTITLKDICMTKSRIYGFLFYPIQCAQCNCELIDCVNYFGLEPGLVGRFRHCLELVGFHCLEPVGSLLGAGRLIAWEPVGSFAWEPVGFIALEPVGSLLRSRWAHCLEPVGSLLGACGLIAWSQWAHC